MLKSCLALTLSACLLAACQLREVAGTTCPDLDAPLSDSELAVRKPTLIRLSESKVDTIKRSDTLLFDQPEDFLATGYRWEFVIQSGDLAPRVTMDTVVDVEPPTGVSASGLRKRRIIKFFAAGSGGPMTFQFVSRKIGEELPESPQTLLFQIYQPPFSARTKPRMPPGCLPAR